MFAKQKSNVLRKLQKSKEIIFMDYCRDTDTSIHSSRLNLDSIYTHRLI